MKKHYLFIALFGIWCLLSSLWYFSSVKGVKTDPPVFNPHESFIAIIEILIMLLVACLLGYAIAWWLRSELIELMHEKVDKLNAEKVFLVESHDDLKNQVEQWREKHRLDLGASQLRVGELISEREKAQKQLADFEFEKSEMRQETLESKNNIQQLDLEISTARYRIRQLEFQVKESDETILRLNKDLETAQARKEIASLSDHPFVRQLEPEQKDDLTIIKGIGPFIEKRLNVIGIYTFQQLADLSPELVDRVGAAIEFFPHRITRDDWVGQAKRLSHA
jgi:predicted flap endonuclease-1-like 5' DNA nuclease